MLSDHQNVTNDGNRLLDQIYELNQEIELILKDNLEVVRLTSQTDCRANRRCPSASDFFEGSFKCREWRSNKKLFDVCEQIVQSGFFFVSVVSEPLGLRGNVRRDVDASWVMCSSFHKLPGRLSHALFCGHSCEFEKIVEVVSFDST